VFTAAMFNGIKTAFETDVLKNG